MVKKQSFVFYIAWVLLIFSLLMDYTIFKVGPNANILLSIIKIIRYIAYFLCCIKIIMGKYRINTLLFCMIISIVFVLSYLGSANRIMCTYLLILFGSVQVDSMRTIKIAGTMQFCFLCIMIFLSRVGLVTDYVFDPNNRMRHGLGFAWTTTAPIVYFFTMLCYIYIRREKISYLEYIIMEVINIWLYKMTDTRMAFVLSSIFLIFFFIERLFRHRWKYWKCFSKFYFITPVAICVFAIMLHWNYNIENEIWRKLNTLLSNRLELGYQAIQTYGISLFGQNIHWIGFSIGRDTTSKAIGYNYVDCSYLQIMLEYGVIFLIAIVSIYMVAVYRAVKREDYYLVCILLIVLVFGITEPRLLNLAFNPFPFIAFCDLDLPKKQVCQL